LLGLLIGGCAVLGLVVGSFLNVVIYRVPRHESIISPRSKCTVCGTPILERDNIPVVSWLLLRAKCRTCHAPISARYPLVELATALLFGGAAARLGYQWALGAYLVMLAGLLALSYIDVDKLLLPLRIVYPTVLLMAALFVLAASLDHTWHRLLVAVIGAAAWYVLFFALNLASATCDSRSCADSVSGGWAGATKYWDSSRPISSGRSSVSLCSRPSGFVGTSKFPMVSFWRWARVLHSSPVLNC